MKRFYSMQRTGSASEIIEIKTAKFNVTADSYIADAAECPNYGEVCCPGRFVEPDLKEETQVDGVWFDPST